jgi:hypothetical protein
MAQRIDFGTHPGSISGLVGQDLIVEPAAVQPYSVDTVFLRTTDDTTDDLVAAVHNATGGGGDSLACTIPDGSSSATSTAASIAVEVGESLYLRVSSGNALRMNLFGYADISPAATAAALLSTIARVKAFRGISGSGDDDLLNTLLAGVSQRMKSYMRRSIVSAAITDEKHDGDGESDTIVLADYPVIQPPAVVLELNGTAVDTDDYEVDEERGLLVRVTDGASSAWTAGRRNYSVDYTAGYAIIPEDLVEIATKQTAHEYNLSSANSMARLGLRGAILDPGGDATYLTGPWIPGATAAMDLYRDLRPS